MPVTILRRNNIAWGNVAGIPAFAAETSLVFVLTLYLQQVLGYSALGAGLHLRSAVSAPSSAGLSPRN